ncbi:Oidioi.mRNA.OKI2018_I69.PAR.g12878.t1.cds [Oikopleura dioica]|uniref:Oidioi.mRNA.OKI2018_I69.PAR.g12878.t1.cds n=1 Tax=Oikopleura dioica TaxID=34765 RepID=A0ABN7S9U6_OIKDI|nr:Oidioi.mRNA.OKI2018_I69.PAR.g12878.t1.cds [Oikopleura dioica]
MSMESTILTKPECLVYRLPPRNSVRGYRAADWGLDKPAWTGRMRVTARDEKVSIKLEDTTNGQLFAECPITEYPTKDIESVNDSSRYFVLRIQNQGRSAFIGVGFRDRGDSFDFNVALQDHYKWVKNANAPSDPGNVKPLNLGLAEGQTIKINLSGKMGEGRERPKQAASTSGISLLPPPPSKTNPAAPAAPGTASGNLLNLAPPPQPAAPSSSTTDDDFGDFSAPTTQSSNWVSF